MTQPRAFLTLAHPARPEGLSFRPIDDGDLPFLASLYADSRHDELAPVQWPEEAKLAFLQQQFEQQHSYYSSNYVGADRLLVQFQQEPIGRVYVYRSASDIRLMDIAILRSRRARGFGRAMLAELIDESDRSGARISLHVESNNPAMAWYRRLGFEHLEDRGVYQFLARPAGAQAIT
jgi:ribosomal protein S18 acetylase RimI-like enzyme